MFLGRVKGHVVATVKDASMGGSKLLIVEPLKVDYDHDKLSANGADTVGRFGVTGRAIVAMDLIGAGLNQLVLVTQGSSARMAEGCNKIPTDAVIIGIVDEATVGQHKVYEAGS